MTKFFGLILFVSIFFQACSGVKTLSRIPYKDLYRKEFLAKISGIKSLYELGRYDAALKAINSLDVKDLKGSEIALKRNLLGVIFFSKENFEKAIFNFNLAISGAEKDPNLTAQVYLNLSSSYYRLGLMDKAYEAVLKVRFEYLNFTEASKTHRLLYSLSKELGYEDTELRALVRYLGKYKNISALKIDKLFEVLKRKFFTLDEREKIRFIEDYEKEKYLCIGYLGYLSVETLFYSGKKELAKETLEFIKNVFIEDEDLNSLMENFYYRIENYARISNKSIGIILPLSGKKSLFGQRALKGIDTALSEFLGKDSDGKKYKLFIKDSKGSGALGAFRTKELIEKYNVSAIIGGLFSHEAEQEYLEAKKHGAFFISLSQIYLPKEQKDHLLLEIPGSVESQINKLFSDKILNRFGKKVAIVYPKSMRGKAFLNEFWRQSQDKSVMITGIIGFEKNKSDYRDPIKNLLGLKYKRVRQEELDLLKEIHSLEKKGSIRRIQDLKPQIDFDWVYIPAFPREALQIVPSFAYYDAFNLNIFGGPSWRTRTFSRESKKLKGLHFMGDDISSTKHDFINKYLSRYGKRPRLIEMRAYDSFKILSLLLDNNEFKSRDELDVYIKVKDYLKGVTGKWSLIDGVWTKNLKALKFKNGKIKNVFEDEGN